jgi:hypothetical protein
MILIQSQLVVIPGDTITISPTWLDSHLPRGEWLSKKLLFLHVISNCPTTEFLFLISTITTDKILEWKDSREIIENWNLFAARVGN